MEILDLIKRRVSIRKYKSEEVPEEILMKVLEAGRLAPSARNDQNWNFVLLRDPEKKDELYKACDMQASVKTAPAAIIVWTRNNTPYAVRHAERHGGQLDSSVVHDASGGRTRTRHVLARSLLCG